MNITRHTLRQAKFSNSLKKNNQLWQIYSFLHKKASYSEKHEGLVCEIFYDNLCASLNLQKNHAYVLVKELEQKKLLKRFKVHGNEGGTFIFLYQTGLLMESTA